MSTHEKLSDYLARRVAELGVTNGLMLAGGDATQRDDSFGRREDLKPVFNHHEHACAVRLGARRASGDAQGDARAHGEHARRRVRLARRPL